MIGLAVILAATLAALVGVVIWLAHANMVAVEHAADARVAQVTTEAELSRVRYELEVERKALDAAHARAAALEEAMAEEINRTPNGDLDRTDIRSRVARFAQRWREADRARSAAVTPPVEESSKDGSG